MGGSRALLSDGQLYSMGAHHFVGLSEETGNAGFAFIPGQQLTFRGDRGYVATGKEIIAVDREVHAKASRERQALFVKRRSLRGDAKKLAEVGREMKKLAEEGIIWRVPFIGESSLVLCGNAVVGGKFDGVAAFDIENGKQLWDAKVEGEVRGLAVGNKRLAVSTTKGHIYTFSSQPGAPAKVAKYPNTSEVSPWGKDKLSAMYAKAAEEILARSETRGGFCLILGSEEGRLAYELARRAPNLRFYGIESDAEKARRSRENLRNTGWYGHRITISQGTT